MAALLGIVTLSVTLLWERFRPARLRLLPGALLGIVAATAIAQVFHFQVQRVLIPASLREMIHLPSLAGLSGMSWGEVAGSACAIAFIASAETLLSASALDKMQSRAKTDYDKELAAQGVGNLLCGLVGSLPMTGVIVRSSTNVLAGAQTRRSTILHGAWVLLAVVAIPSVMNMIPTASLAAVLVYVGIKLVRPADVRKLSRFGKVPVLIYFASLATIVTTNLLTGVLVGVGLSLMKLLYTITHLEATVIQESAGTHIHLSGIATFLGIPKIASALDQVGPDCKVKVHGEELRYIDHACIELIEEWAEQRERAGQHVEIAFDRLHLRFRTKVSQSIGTKNLNRETM